MYGPTDVSFVSRTMLRHTYSCRGSAYISVFSSLSRGMICIGWFKHILFRKISMYNMYCHKINTLGYERKQNAYIVLLLGIG